MQSEQVIWYFMLTKKRRKNKTFIGFSTSPPHRERNEMRKGLHVGFRLFFITCANSFVMSKRCAVEIIVMLLHKVYLCPVSQLPSSFCLSVELQERIGPPKILNQCVSSFIIIRQVLVFQSSWSWNVLKVFGIEMNINNTFLSSWRAQTSKSATLLSVISSAKIYQKQRNNSGKLKIQIQFRFSNVLTCPNKRTIGRTVCCL